MIPDDRSNCAARPIFAISTLVLLLCGLTACVGFAGETAPPDESAAPYVQIRLDERRIYLPPGVSLIVEGGGLINNGFPAMSADGDRIAVFYFAGSPWVGGYPTLDIYSTAILELVERIEFGPRPVPSPDPAPNTPDVRNAIERRLIDVNRALAQSGFRPMPMLFDFTKQKFYAPIERLDMRIERVARDGTEVLIVTSIDTQQVELELPMPTIPVYTQAEDPDNNCVVQGGVLMGWYAPKEQLLVLQMYFGGGRDGCELPEKWIIKRL